MTSISPLPLRVTSSHDDRHRAPHRLHHVPPHPKPYHRVLLMCCSPRPEHARTRVRRPIPVRATLIARFCRLTRLIDAARVPVGRRAHQYPDIRLHALIPTIDAAEKKQAQRYMGEGGHSIDVVVRRDSFRSTARPRPRSRPDRAFLGAPPLSAIRRALNPFLKIASRPSGGR